MSGLRNIVGQALAAASKEKPLLEQEENLRRMAAIQASLGAVTKEDGSNARCEICGAYKESARWIQHQGDNYSICRRDTRRLKLENLGF